GSSGFRCGVLRLLVVLAAGSSACSCGPLKLGEACDRGTPDPCPSGLECRDYISFPTGDTRDRCQVPFGSVSGRLGQACGTGFHPSEEEIQKSMATDCAPAGLECLPSGTAGGGLTSSCQRPEPGSRCADSVGCASGYPCLPYPFDGNSDSFHVC